jgi:hypothetical protein
MSPSLHPRARQVVSRIGWLPSLVVVLTLLAFPMQRTHQFTDHFRTSEARRSVERHTFLGQPELDPAERVAYCAGLPTLPVRIEIIGDVKPRTGIEFAPPVPLQRLLSRLKLGPSRGSGPDPLL